MMSSSFRILKVRGISIGAHWSWLLVFGLVTWSLSTELFPRTYPDLGRQSYLLMGVVAASIFFLSIILHELGHAFRALREGMKVGDITLWLFGGVARFEGMFPSAGAEFRVAIAGPLVSLVLAVAFAGAAWLGGLAGLPGQLRGVAEYLAKINGAVLAFNLVPALPLDGGRILRSWLWRRQRDLTAATFSAARAGKAFAFLLMTMGILGLFTHAVDGGVWMVFLGFFILQAAQAEVNHALIITAFEPYRVKDLMVTETTGGPAPEGSVVVASDSPMVDVLAALRSDSGPVVVTEQGNVVGSLSALDVARTLEAAGRRDGVRPAGVRGSGWGVWVVVALLMALAAAAFYRPPLAVISPAPAIDIGSDISIKGAGAGKLSGKYLLLAVRIDQTNLLGTALAMISPSSDVIPFSSVVPPGVSGGDYTRQQKNLFTESQMMAAAAAAQSVGMKVDLNGSGVRVVGVLPGSPAGKVLKVGDVIVAVDSAPVKLATELGAAISGRPAGTGFALTVERGGRQVQVPIRSATLERQSPPGIGILIETRDFKVNLPFEITFRERDVGGPSAGLAYSLAIADLLDNTDIAGNRTIAASGTVAVDGEVGPVGGLGQKTKAAKDAGADILLVPQQEAGSITAGRLPLRGVATVREALSALQTG